MKRISPATVTVGVLAIFVGLAAAYATRRYFEPRVAADPGVPVVVSRINLPPFARIRDEDVEVVHVPVGRVPEGAVANRSRALFRHVRQTILAGQPVLEEQLYEVGKAPTLAEQIPAGHRAVTIAVDPNNALDGLLLPESLVDISLTVRGDHPELAGVATTTLLRSVKVLATNRDRYRTEERLEQNLRSVTVAATPEQANKLILAQRYGTLSVSLRSAADLEGLAHEGGDDLVNTEDLLGLGPAREVKSEIWRGTSVEAISFRAEQIAEAEAATAARLRERGEQGTNAAVRYRRVNEAPVEAPVRDEAAPAGEAAAEATNAATAAWAG